MSAKQFKRDESQNSNKLHLDKYYTSTRLAKQCILKTYEVIGKENITEVVEPAAGTGSFSNQIKDCIAYDIEPEGEGIIEQDFLELDLKYKQGRLIIGNPPFGSRNTLAVQFFKKSIEISDYIAFILPISQLNNNQQMYEFDLVYSEDLGEQLYSDRSVHCCFNIYKKPLDNKLNKKPVNKLKDVVIHEVRMGSKKVENYDLAICAWGSNIGGVIEYEHQYSKEFYVEVRNEQLRDKIINVIKDTDWIKIYPMTSTPNLLQWQVYRQLREQIPEIR